jgi:nucleoside-diphosphate-sugar epimerase
VKAAAYDPAQAFNNESCAGIPQDDYAYSKCLAEQRLQALDWGQCRLTIVRPALVIGPEVKGNMALLQKYAARWYFPMISGGGERSLLMLPDLLDLLIVLIERESSPSPCYIASSQHLSVGEQIAAIRKAAAVGKPHWRIPASLLRRMLSIIDRVTLRKLLLNEKADKMLSRECYSACLAEQELSWQPQQQLPAMLDGERVH